MTALQKEVYKSILSARYPPQLVSPSINLETGQNVEVLKSIALSAAGAKVNAAVKKSNMNNILMQLRKQAEPSLLFQTSVTDTILGVYSILTLSQRKSNQLDYRPGRPMRSSSEQVPSC